MNTSLLSENEEFGIDESLKLPADGVTELNRAKMFLPGGPVVFSRGSDTDIIGVGEFLGTLDDKLTAGYVVAQVVMQLPSEGTPYVGITIKIPNTSVDDEHPLSYGKQSYASHELKFWYDALDLSFKKISSQEDPERVHLSNLGVENVTGDILVVRFRAGATRPWAVGHNWPSCPVSDQAKDAHGKLGGFVTATEWIVYCPYADKFIGLLLGIGKYFSDVGKPPRLLDHYRNRKGHVE